jgi:lysophospholipase L1-like esterase
MTSWIVAFALYAALHAVGVSGASLAPDANQWVRSWGAAMQAPDTPEYFPDAGKRSRDQTLRQIVRLSLGGSHMRVWVSNDFGDRPLTVKEAHIAVSEGGAVIRAGSDRVLTFGGSRSITIPAGVSFVSDVVSLSVPNLGRVAVSLYLPESTMNSIPTVHQDGRNTGYFSTLGNHAADLSLPVMNTTQALFFLSAIDVVAGADSFTLIALGDSITDGFASTPDRFGRWPDDLAERLAQRGGNKIAVDNSGISGNRILRDWTGPSALARFDRDVLGAPNVRYLIILEGINDIGAPGYLKRAAEQVDSKDIIEGFRQLCIRARQHGIKVFLGTIMPSGGTNEQNPGYDTPAGEQVRQEVNSWIRHQDSADGVIDFDQAVRDPNQIRRLRPDYDSGDHLHPNDVGYRAISNAVDLRLFD